MKLYLTLVHSVSWLWTVFFLNIGFFIFQRVTVKILKDFLQLCFRERQTFSVKGHLVNMLSFTGHKDFVTTIQLCCSTKAPIDNMEMNKHGCVLETVCWIWPIFTSLCSVSLTRDRGSYLTVN